jgi:hypothetical protein
MPDAGPPWARPAQPSLTCASCLCGAMHSAVTQVMDHVPFLTYGANASCGQCPAQGVHHRPVLCGYSGVDGLAVGCSGTAVAGLTVPQAAKPLVLLRLLAIECIHGWSNVIVSQGWLPRGVTQTTAWRSLTAYQELLLVLPTPQQLTHRASKRSSPAARQRRRPPDRSWPLLDCQLCTARPLGRRALLHCPCHGSLGAVAKSAVRVATSGGGRGQLSARSGGAADLAPPASEGPPPSTDIAPLPAQSLYSHCCLFTYFVLPIPQQLTRRASKRSSPAARQRRWPPDRSWPLRGCQLCTARPLGRRALLHCLCHGSLGAVAKSAQREATSGGGRGQKSERSRGAADLTPPASEGPPPSTDSAPLPPQSQYRHCCLFTYFVLPIPQQLTRRATKRSSPAARQRRWPPDKSLSRVMLHFINVCALVSFAK